MPINFSEIQRINGITNFSIHSDIKIINYINNYINNDKIEFPKWQREDCWNDDYRTTLIESILLCSDLPKIYLSKQPDGRFYLLDGGHRTRTIKKFMDNNYYIIIDDQHVYYNKAPTHESRNNRILNDYEKNIFDNYLLTITIYENLSEKESRNKFNKLQNAQPMSMADIINSHESPLVDYLRSLKNFTIDNQHLCNYFDNYKKVLVKSQNSHMLYQLASWFTICFPLDDGNKADVALDYALKGEKKETSTTYKYILKHDEDITSEDKIFFQYHLTNLITQIFEFKSNSKHLSIAEWSSILHANIYINNFNIDKFIVLHTDLIQYACYEKESKDQAKATNFESAKQLRESADALNSNYENNLSEWKKLKSNANRNGMKVRYDIIKKYCVDVENDVVVNDDDNFTPLPIVD